MRGAGEENQKTGKGRRGKRKRGEERRGKEEERKGRTMGGSTDNTKKWEDIIIG